MVYFQTENPNLSEFWRVLQWKMLVYFNVICSILRPLGIYWTFSIFCGNMVYFLQNLVCCTKKNLAALQQSRKKTSKNQATVPLRPLQNRTRQGIGNRQIVKNRNNLPTMDNGQWANGFSIFSIAM
jgi:hypothetical protein